MAGQRGGTAGPAFARLQIDSRARDGATLDAVLAQLDGSDRVDMVLVMAGGNDVVRLFRERADDPFVQQPGLHAADGLHPSDAGYRVWFGELTAQAGLAQRLSAARGAAPSAPAAR
ncbi:hypothetical protein ACPOLB_00620 [Rubrivivax sp. RP6-9]|uniref:hypothetical protein n=1 Tax=Rubrivivax sp. RP6-9 TaxID=3415750 RepID=UPI003CC66108